MGAKYITSTLETPEEKYQTGLKKILNQFE